MLYINHYLKEKNHSNSDPTDALLRLYRAFSMNGYFRGTLHEKLYQELGLKVSPIEDGVSVFTFVFKIINGTALVFFSYRFVPGR